MVLYLFVQNKPQLRRNLVALSFHHVFVWWRIFRTNLDDRRTRHPGLEERYSHPHTLDWWYLRYSNLLLKYKCTDWPQKPSSRYLPSLHCWPTTPKIVGCYMLRCLHSLLHVVACCWELWRKVWNRWNFYPRAYGRNTEGKKSLSSLFILEKRKRRTFPFKDDNDK